MTKTPYLKHFQFFSPQVGRRYRYHRHLHKNSSLHLIMIGEDHLHIIKKVSGPRVEPCGMPYFNVPLLEKTLSIQTENLLLER